MTNQALTVHDVVGVSVDRDVTHTEHGGYRALTLRVEMSSSFGGSGMIEITLFADDPGVLEPLAALTPSVKVTP